MTTALPLTVPNYVESYLVIRAPLDVIHGYMALKADEDDLGTRVYCEYQHARTGLRALLFSYDRGGSLEDWTYVLTDGAFDAHDFAAMLDELGIDVAQIDSARTADGEPLIDLTRIADAMVSRTFSEAGHDLGTGGRRARLRASEAIFEVASDATSAEIKAAAEALLGAEVRSVDLIADPREPADAGAPQPLPRRAVVSFQPLPASQTPRNRTNIT